MVRLRSIAGLALLAAALAARAEAGQDPQAPDQGSPDALMQMGLEDLLKLDVGTVVGASRFVQDIRQAPASVAVVTAEEIRLQGFRTLADVLRSVRGFYVSYDRNYSYLGVRGFSRPGDYNSRILLLVNGHRLNDAIYDSAMLGTDFPIDVALLDRVEIIRGPSSSLYGTSAFFAVVNLLTRPASDFKAGEVAVEGGTLGTVRLRGTVAGRTAGGAEGLLSATHYRSDGQSVLHYPELDAPGVPAIARGLDGDEASSVFASFRSGQFVLSGAFASRDKSIPTGAFATVLDRPGTHTVDANGHVEASYAHRLPQRWSVELRGGLDRYTYKGDYVTEGEDGDPPYLFVDDVRALDVTGGFTLGRTGTRHVFTAGLEAQWNLQQDQLSYDPESVVVDAGGRSKTAGAYVQDEWRLSSRVLVNAGVRLDHYDTFGATVNPRLGVILTPRAETVVKLLAGRAFRAPSAYELYYYNAGLPDRLQPEKVWTGEVAWDERITSYLDASVSAYSYRANDLIDQFEGADTLDGLYFANAGVVSASGVEAEARFHWASGLRVRVSHSLGRSEGEHGATLSNSPRHLSRAAVVAPLGWGGLVVGANAEFIGERLSAGGAEVPRAGLANVTISRAGLGRRAALSCSVYNLFDSAYHDPASGEHRQTRIGQDGRTVLARMTWAF